MNNGSTPVLIDLIPLFILCIICLCSTSLHAANLPCRDWENKLLEQVSNVNSCASKLKACIDKEYGNPMRELNYCQHIDKNCRALDDRPGNNALAADIAEFKKTCVKD